MRLIIGMAGASGIVYGIRMLEILRDVPEVETHLVMSTTARMNASIETDMKPAQIEALADHVHKLNDMAASIASGSFPVEGMVVAPCSMKTLSAIANSYADNLLVRAADVTLKEGRRLVLMPRETPLHAGHCKLLYEVALMGAIVAPPMPAFYNRPQTIDDIVTHSVGRVLDLFGLDPGVVQRWQGAND
jgi:flavin prenyltransferase